MDEADRGNIIADRFRDDALARMKARAIASAPSRKECRDCGEAIPEARRKAMPGCVRCVQCETEFEGRQHV